MDPIVTVSIEHEVDGKRYTVQTQFCYSQFKDAPPLFAPEQIKLLHKQLTAAIPHEPKHVHCTDGSVRVRKHW